MNARINSVSDVSFFVVLARHPNLAAAAVELGITPSNVSRRLANLEHRLGLRLVQRTTRRMHLTVEGQRYLDEGLRILQDLEGLEQSLMTDRATPKGLLRLNGTFGFGRRHLAPLISDFARRYPEVEVVLELTDHPMDLVQHGMDVGIRFGAPPDTRVVARRIASNRRLLCASPGYLSQHGIPSTPQALGHHHCIVIRENTTAFHNWALTDGQHKAMVKVQGPLSTNHGEIAVDWALAGHGIVLRSEWDVAAYLHSGQLCRVLPDWTGDQADIHAIYPHRHHLSAKVRVFLDFLSDRFADYRPGPSGATASPWT